MKTRTGKWAWIILGMMWIVAGMLYDGMPDQMASHWNARGIADGYTGRTGGMLMLPIIALVMQGMFILMPRIDPLKKNIVDFRRQYEGFALLFMLFMAYLYGVIIVWNLGIVFEMNQVIIPAFAGLFYGIGALLKDSKRNWFIGIRTPWTLSNDLVWEKTHTLGSALFKFSAALTLLGMVLPQYALAAMLVPIMASSIIAVVYSYLVFRKQK